jgi:hypothetical protein
MDTPRVLNERSECRIRRKEGYTAFVYIGLLIHLDVIEIVVNEENNVE